MYHGRNDGAIGAKYQDVRTLANDLKNSTGDYRCDNIKDVLQPWLNPNNPMNRFRVMVEFYNTFKRRTGKDVDGEDADSEMVGEKL